MTSLRRRLILAKNVGQVRSSLPKDAARRRSGHDRSSKGNSRAGYSGTVGAVNLIFSEGSVSQDRTISL